MAGYIGSKVAVVSSGAERKKVFTATSGQTSFTGLSYTVNNVHVFQNGVRLVDGTDYTATNGNSITLTVGASTDDQVVVVSYSGFTVGDVVPASTGGTFSNAVTVDADGATVLTVDRATSDGDIMEFQKDGTAVGSIKSRSGVVSAVILDPRNPTYEGVGLGAGSYDTTTSLLIPTDGSGANSDGAMNLGGTTTRFKDLYLSGGVYLGGTGSANKLEDYEEGTWTPTVETGTIVPNYATYVKVGNLVTLSAYISTFSDRATASSIQLTGLPFLSASATVATGAVLARYINIGTGGDPVAYTAVGNNRIDFYAMTKGGNYINVRHSDLNHPNANFYVTISYRTS